jgi:hypothetical protein
MSRILIVGLTSHLWADCLDNVGSLTSHNPRGLHSLLQDSFLYEPALLLIFCHPWHSFSGQNVHQPSCSLYLRIILVLLRYESGSHNADCSKTLISYQSGFIRTNVYMNITFPIRYLLSSTVVFNLGYTYPHLTSTRMKHRNCLNLGCHTHKDSSPTWGAGMPETSSVISLTGLNHINNL